MGKWVKNGKNGKNGKNIQKLIFDILFNSIILFCAYLLCESEVYRFIENVG